MTAKVLRFVGPTRNEVGQLSVAYTEHNRSVEGMAGALGLALKKMLLGWEAYADAHRFRYEASIGQDGVIGRYWAEAGLAIKRLLDGDTGGLDGGSIAANITSMIEAESFKTDGYTLTE